MTDELDSPAWRPALGDWVVMTRSHHKDDPEVGTVWKVTDPDGDGMSIPAGCYVHADDRIGPGARSGPNAVMWLDQLRPATQEEVARVQLDSLEGL